MIRFETYRSNSLDAFCIYTFYMHVVFQLWDYCVFSLIQPHVDFHLVLFAVFRVSVSGAASSGGLLRINLLFWLIHQITLGHFDLLTSAPAAQWGRRLYAGVLLHASTLSPLHSL